MDGSIIPPETGSGCHGGRETLLQAARSAGKSDVMDRLMADYPRGPHDQPQSMCPAFGALRVGLRMRRTATILSGSACCVYGLTFTSHFYGAKRTVGYVPFNSETLVRGQLYEDIRNAVFEIAKPENYDAVVVINLCVPTASGVPLDRLPKVHRRRARHRHRCPRLRCSHPCRGEGRPRRRHAALRPSGSRGRPGRPAPRGQAELPTVSLIGELFPVDPMGVGRSAGPDGSWRSGRRCRRANGGTYTAHWTALQPRPCIRSTPPRSARCKRLAARSLVPGPVGLEGTAAWLDAIGAAANVATDQDRRRQGQGPARHPRRPGRQPDQRPHHCLRLRRLRTAGRPPADRSRRRSALRRHRLPQNGIGAKPDRDWLEARGTHVQYRASLEQDCRRHAGRAPRSRRRHHAPGAKGQGARHSRPCTSPTWSLPAPCSARPEPARWPRSSPPRHAASDRFARMVSFFDKCRRR